MDQGYRRGEGERHDMGHGCKRPERAQGGVRHTPLRDLPAGRGT